MSHAKYEKVGQINSKSLSYNWEITKCCLVASFSVFMLNYNMSIVNIPQKYMHICKKGSPLSYYGLTRCVSIDNLYWDYIASIINIGAILGSLTFIYLSCKIGRRNTLIINNLGYLIGCLLFFLGNDKYVLLIGRFITGVSCGIGKNVAYLYIAEIATQKCRGSVSLLIAVVGALGNISSLTLGTWFSGYLIWRALFAILIVPIIIHTYFLFRCCETPRYSLIYLKNETKAKRDLSKLRDGCNIEEEFEEIKQSNRNTNVESGQLKAIQMLLSKQYRKRFLIVFLIMMGQGLSGTSAINYYSSAILDKHFSHIQSSIFIIFIYLFGVVGCIFASFFVDVFGRKVFIVFGQLSMGISCLVIVAGNVTQLSSLVFIGLMLTRLTYEIGLSGIPFIIVSEMFPTCLSSGGSGIVYTVNWISHFIVGSTFSMLELRLGPYAFSVYAIINISVAFVLLVMLPETKGKSLEEIDHMFTKKA